MGEIVTKPNLNVPNIVVPNINTDDEDGANSIINTWGIKFPLIEINGYLIPSGGVREFSMTYSLNKFPRISFTVEDSRYELRRTLKKEIVDKGILFLGFKDFYIKFNIIILDIPNDFGGDNITINAEFFNESLYVSQQKSYNEMSVMEVIEDICKQTGMGFYNNKNELTSTKITNNINCKTKLIDFLDYNIKNFTNSIYSIDGHGYIHVGDVATLRGKEVDTYIWKNSQKLDSPKPLIITNRMYKTLEDGDNPETDFKLQTLSYNVSTNIGLQHIENMESYSIVDESGKIKELKSQTDIGISRKVENTFNKFLDLYNGGSNIYRNILSKDLSGKIITVQLTEMILEIVPFSIVKLELYLPKLEGVDAVLDEDNSGNKIVIGVDYSFESASDDDKYPRTKQTLFLI